MSRGGEEHRQGDWSALRFAGYAVSPKWYGRDCGLRPWAGWACYTQNVCVTVSLWRNGEASVSVGECRGGATCMSIDAGRGWSVRKLASEVIEKLLVLPRNDNATVCGGRVVSPNGVTVRAA